jgi:hypothetical protein
LTVVLGLAVAFGGLLRLRSVDCIAGLTDDRHRLGDGDRRAGLNDVFEHGPASAGNQLHDCLIGLDLGQDIADGDRLALLLFPFDQAALFHGR